MPTESTPPVPPQQPPSSQGNIIKCTICGTGSLASPSRNPTNDVVVLSDPIERICGGCTRATQLRVDSQRQDYVEVDHRTSVNVDLEQHISTLRVDDAGGREASLEENHQDFLPSSQDSNTRIVNNVILPLNPSHQSLQPQSLPTQPIQAWVTSNHPQTPHHVASPQTSISPHNSFPVNAASSVASGPTSAPTHDTIIPSKHINHPPNPTQLPRLLSEDNLGHSSQNKLPDPLLDITSTRIPSIGRGALHPGSIFRGTQTSGRSAYDVEVKLLDVNFTESTLSGFLSISHLTDAHPQLTTFFTAEIIGPQFGFITGTRYGATEHDDMRHWGRFEQFRRPATKADIVRSEMLFRDPIPDRSRGESTAKERDFVFLRIKERFLVPDHTVKDISGASFAGFYFAMVDLSPTLGQETQLCPPSPIPASASVVVPGNRPPVSPLSPTSPMARRASAGNLDSRSSSVGDVPRRRRESSGKIAAMTPRGEATLRGYYFHSLNQEPFQELYLTHVPNRSRSAVELR
ncbi:hypothetical protein M231_02332 [Tremella mesenterica]|uniref:Vacuolar import and degradation protein n=1 Tax=Tremella mesenterica TaxID=5217 RepID=A0A4Q1BQX4_TREME|nr:uncharacterized protein TREMEDRAFT_65283 [Tremella mesenterica DSM 1558]EIW66431.1 hypothetical protein TREMEDRAFT_65283 [Tremella mesenterica DSM 1558]RXK40349.1 hypothetical protein M231_02332 [Tremella mesenterica]